MALFGAPIAHEDHARRACYAALYLGEELRRYAEELRRTRGLGFSIRTGLNSGEVIVGAIGDDLRMDYTAQPARPVGISDALGLVNSVVNGLLWSGRQLNDPNSSLSKDVDRWLAEVTSETGTTALRVYNAVLKVRRCGDLECFPTVKFVFLRSSNGVGIEPELMFVRRNAAGRREFKVVLQWGGTKGPERKLLKENLNNSGVRTIYVPDRAAPKNPRWPWTDDVRFLLLLYLVQHEMISLDQEDAAGEFLLAYLAKFRDAKKPKDGLILSHLLKQYGFAMDYRGLGPYIAKVARGLAAAELDRAQTSYILEEETPHGIRTSCCRPSQESSISRRARSTSGPGMGS
jgi:hypothetical protein